MYLFFKEVPALYQDPPPYVVFTKPITSFSMPPKAPVLNMPERLVSTKKGAPDKNEQSKFELKNYLTTVDKGQLYPSVIVVNAPVMGASLLNGVIADFSISTLNPRSEVSAPETLAVRMNLLQVPLPK